MFLVFMVCKVWESRNNQMLEWLRSRFTLNQLPHILFPFLGLQCICLNVVVWRKILSNTGVFMPKVATLSLMFSPWPFLNFRSAFFNKFFLPTKHKVSVSNDFVVLYSWVDHEIIFQAHGFSFFLFLFGRGEFWLWFGVQKKKKRIFSRQPQ